MPIPAGWPPVYAYTLLVQADLSGTAFGGAPTWTDITRFVRLPDSIGITSWRQDALSTVSPSTMGLTLDNTDIAGDAVAPNGGRFTPGLATSPWYGKILPGVRFRVTVTPGAGTAVALFDGYATDWDAAYDTDGAFSTCKVNCVDILGWMGNLQTLRSMLAEQMLLDNPTAYFPLNDPQGATSPGLYANGSSISPSLVQSKYGGGTAVFGNVSGPAATGDSSLTLNTPAAGGQHGMSLLVNTPNRDVRLVEFWFNTTAATTQDLLSGYSGGTAPTIMLQLNAAGKLIDPFATATTAAYNDGVWHHVAVDWNIGGVGPNVYVDGVLSTLRVLFTSVLRLYFGGYMEPSPTVFFYTGSIAHVAVSNTGTAISAARVLAHYQAGTTGFQGESTNSRITRLLTLRTNTGSALDTGEGTVGQQFIGGVTLQQALLDVGKAEGGVVYADGQGRIVLLNRTRLRNPAAAATLNAEADLTVDYDARIDLQQLVNDVTITRAAGATQRVTDATSQSVYGVRATSDTLVVNSDSDAANAAGWQVANGKDALVRTPNLICDLLTQSDTAKAQTILGLAPLQRVALTNLPTTAPATDVIAQGRSVTISHDTFTVGFYTTRLPRPTLRFDAAASAQTKLDVGNVIAW